MSSSEFDIIHRFFDRPVDRSSGVVLGIGDDAAVVQPAAGYELVIAADVLNEGIHFPVDTDPHAVGYKALAVNLSDLAAMGAEPQWFTMTLSLPESDEAWIAEFSRGLFEVADKHDIILVGGDTVKGPLSIGIHVIGKVPTGEVITRGGANIGDKIFVSGSLGDAALALQQIKDDDKGSVNQQLRRKLDYPNPRLQLGSVLREVATSCIDISDGLIADLTHILKASNKGALLEVDSIPLSDEYLDNVTGKKHELAISGGDDYELCFTVASNSAAKLESVADELKILVTCIGEITDNNKLELSGSGISIDDLMSKGFDHFIV